MLLTRQPQKHIQKMRKRFKRHSKEVFQRMGKRELVSNGLPKSMIYEMERHHIIPLSLGGTNDVSNLAFVKPDLHKVIHEFILSQCVDMRVGEERDIRIPTCPKKVWLSFEQLRL